MCSVVYELCCVSDCCVCVLLYMCSVVYVFFSIHSGVGHFDDSGGKNSLHLKFDGDPETVKKVEVELKQLEKKVWHEKLHLVKDVAPEKR